VQKINNSVSEKAKKMGCIEIPRPRSKKSAMWPREWPNNARPERSVSTWHGSRCRKTWISSRPRLVETENPGNLKGRIRVRVKIRFKLELKSKDKPATSRQIP